MIECSKCKKEYPETAEYFHRNKIKKNGLSSDCKECRNNWNSNYKKDHPEKYSKYMKIYRNRYWIRIKREMKRERLKKEKQRLGI